MADPAQTSVLPSWLGQVVPWLFTAVAGFYAVIKDRQARRASGKDRRRSFLKQQLDEFYAPALGKAEEITAKSNARLAYSKAMGEVFAQGVPEGARDGLNHFIQYDNRQLREELLPLYRDIAQLFREKRAFVEPSTIEFHPALVTFLDVWDRYLTTEMNFEVAQVLRREQKPLKPLFDDLARHVDRLRTELQSD